jgi:hypothetical protein
MTFSRHRFTRTFAAPHAAPTAHETAVIEEELQQAQPGTGTWNLHTKKLLTFIMLT